MAANGAENTLVAPGVDLDSNKTGIEPLELFLNMTVT